MRTHPEIGAEIIDAHNSPILSLASKIALTHYEKWMEVVILTA
jgi:putative two-component system response regulator